MPDKLLIPVDNLNSYVSHHQYRVSLFKVAFHHQTGHFHEAVIDKKVWCELMEISLKATLRFLDLMQALLVNESSMFRITVLLTACR